MAVRGKCIIKDNKYYLLKDYGNNKSIEILFLPNPSMAMELNKDDDIELRVHRDLREDDSVLYDGKLVKIDKVEHGYKYELEAVSRERLDHRGTYNFWTTYEDAEGNGDIIDPQIGEWLEVRLHVLERVECQ